MEKSMNIMEKSLNTMELHEKIECNTTENSIDTMETSMKNQGNITWKPWKNRVNYEKHRLKPRKNRLKPWNKDRWTVRMINFSAKIQQIPDLSSNNSTN